MERYEDSVELLNEVKRNLVRIREQYKCARKDENIKFVLRPLVKTSLEHLRSILEYSAQDISTFYNSKNKRIYFPYGKDKESFQASVERNLPNIEQNQPLYKLLESLQPHSSGDNWLIDLCTQTNFNKHNSLSKQVRKNSENSITDVGKLLRIDNSSAVTFNDCTYNGKPLGQGKSAVISGSMTTDEIKKIIGIPIPVEREFEWIEFLFENSAQDTLQLIEKSHYKISQYIEKLKNQLS